MTVGAKGNSTHPEWVAAALAFASELIHLWVLPGEFVIRPLSGSFVLLVAVCQGILAVSLLFGPGKWMLRFGILLNVGVVSTWAITRFAGVPLLFGFTRLPVELPNLAATAAEVALVVLLVRLRRNLPRLTYTTPSCPPAESRATGSASSSEQMEELPLPSERLPRRAR